MRGLGSGKFAAPKPFAGSNWANYTSIAASGDLNRNGQPDLVGLHKNGHLYFISGTKQGTLAAAQDVRDVGTAYSSIFGSGDMTGDGIGDVAARDRTGGGIHILSGNGAGGFGDTLGKFTGATNVKPLSGARMAGSSHSDLVGLDSTRTKLVMVLHNGLKNVKPLVRTNVTVPGATQLLTPGDWNRDGKHDLITREAAGDRLVLRIGKGNGQYAAGVGMDTGWKPFTYLAAVGDVTGDKNPDLLGAKAAAGPFTVFPGNGKASFRAPTKAPSTLRTFNQIGKGSWAPASARPTYISSDGSFVPVLGSLGEDPAAYNWVVGPGDVDGKGRADLIVRGNAGVLWLLPGSGQGLRRAPADRLRVRRLPARRLTGRLTRTQLHGGPLVRATGGPGGFARMPEQDDRASVHHRRQEDGDSVPGRRVGVGEQSHAALLAGGDGRLEQVRLGLRTLGGDPRDRVRARWGQADEDVALPGPQRPEVEHPTGERVGEPHRERQHRAGDDVLGIVVLPDTVRSADGDRVPGLAGLRSRTVPRSRPRRGRPAPASAAGGRAAPCRPRRGPARR